MVLRQNRGTHKFKKAIKTACRILSPESAAQTQGGSKNGAGVGKDTVTSIGQTHQCQPRQASQEKFQLPSNVRTYPVRSALRGSRPRRATDSARHVHFAAEVRQPIEQKHEILRSPRNYPLRSAMRGSRPKQAKDSSRHVHFASGARRLHRDTDAGMVSCHSETLTSVRILQICIWMASQKCQINTKVFTTVRNSRPKPVIHIPGAHCSDEEARLQRCLEIVVAAFD